MYVYVYACIYIHMCRCRDENMFEQVHVVELLGPEPPRARHRKAALAIA